jgi:hypothetical protein
VRQVSDRGGKVQQSERRGGYWVDMEVGLGCVVHAKWRVDGGHEGVRVRDYRNNVAQIPGGALTMPAG